MLSTYKKCKKLSSLSKKDSASLSYLRHGDRDSKQNIILARHKIYVLVVYVKGKDAWIICSPKHNSPRKHYFPIRWKKIKF